MAETATTYVSLGDATEEYLSFVRAFPLMHIRDDAHLDAAIAVFGPLFEKAEPSVAEKAYMGALADLIETYEDATVHTPERSGLDILRYLVEENGYKQVDLAPIFGSQSVASDVLAGKRAFTLDHMRKAAAFFGVPLATFSGDS